jgi:hypothetical protein
MSPRSVKRSLRILLVCATGNIIAPTGNCLMQSAYLAQDNIWQSGARD